MANKDLILKTKLNDFYFMLHACGLITICQRRSVVKRSWKLVLLVGTALVLGLVLAGALALLAAGAGISALGGRALAVCLALGD